MANIDIIDFGKFSVNIVIRELFQNDNRNEIPYFSRILHAHKYHKYAKYAKLIKKFGLRHLRNKTKG